MDSHCNFVGFNVEHNVVKSLTALTAFKTVLPLYFNNYFSTKAKTLISYAPVLHKTIQMRASQLFFPVVGFVFQDILQMGTVRNLKKLHLKASIEILYLSYMYLFNTAEK